jgi:hypothetical protein
VRTVTTASGATAVQIVWSSRRGGRSIEHIGSGHDDHELAALKAAAAERLAAGRTEMDLGLTPVPGSGPLPIVSTRMSRLWDALSAAYDKLGLRSAAKSDNVFRDLVLARIIEPTSKVDSLRVLEEIGVVQPSDATVKRRPPDLCPTIVATSTVGGMRQTCRAGATVAGALRRDHAVLRDRCR